MLKLCFVEGSGFVYGVMSFTDMIAVGSAIMILQYNAPEIPKDSSTKIEYFRWVIPCCGAGTFMFALIMIIILWPMNIGKR